MSRKVLDDILKAIEIKRDEHIHVCAEERGVSVTEMRRLLEEEEEQQLEKQEVLARNTRIIRKLMTALPDALYDMRIDNYVAQAVWQTAALGATRHWVSCYSSWLHADQRTRGESSLGILFTGTPGTGKTHLAAATLRGCIECGGLGLFIQLAEFLSDIRASYGGAIPYLTVEDVKTTPLLVIDDLGAERSTAWACETVFGILDARLVNRNPTILTTNLTVAELRRLAGGAVSADRESGQMWLPRIYDRVLQIAGDNVIDMRGQSYRQRNV